MLHLDISRRKFMQGLLGTAAVVSVPTLSFAKNSFKETRLLMGTIVDINIADGSSLQASEAIDLAFSEMKRLITMFDRHNSSVISSLNNDGMVSDCPQEFLQVLEQAKSYGNLSSNAFDMTVLPVLNLLEKGASHKEAYEALNLVGQDKVLVSGNKIKFANKEMAITLDGIAKGFIVDMAAKKIEELGIGSYMINAGGDIRCRLANMRERSFKVAIEDPKKQANYPEIVSLRNGAIATSGGYERNFSSNQNHLINPRNGKSPDNKFSVSVKAPTAMQADALATTLSVMSKDKALNLVERFNDHACLIVDSSGIITKSMNWDTI